MSERVCEREGCNGVHEARGLCKRHYAREYERRERVDRPLEARLLRTRARNRATARLIEAHRAEFEQFLEEERDAARAEAAAISGAVADAGHSTAVVKLRPGPRPADESITDRIREDVGRCETCWGHHDAAHICPDCGSGAKPLAVAPQSRDEQIERLLRAGKPASWIAANLGEPMPAVLRVLDRLRKAAS